MISEYKLSGLTCDHCVQTVTEELTAVDGVAGVEVDLVANGVSTVRVTHAAPLTDDAVNAAVVEAGYAMAAPGELQ